MSTCHKLTKLLIRVGHALVNWILDVLDIVLDWNVLILGNVVVGHFDDIVLQSYEKRDMRRLQQQVVFARVLDDLQPHGYVEKYTPTYTSVFITTPILERHTGSRIPSPATNAIDKKQVPQPRKNPI